MNMDFSVPKLRVVVGSLSFLQCAVGEVSSVTLKAMLRRSELPLSPANQGTRDSAHFLREAPEARLGCGFPQPGETTGSRSEM